MCIQMLMTGPFMIAIVSEMWVTADIPIQKDMLRRERNITDLFNKALCLA